MLNAAAGQSWTLAYRPNGIDLVSVTDSLGTLLTLGYTDASNPHRPTTLKDGAGNVWTNHYNAHGQVLTIVPPAGSPTRVTTLVYDETAASSSFGYLKEITNGALDTLTIDSYSALGDPTSVSTSPRSGVTNTLQDERDAGQRLVKLTHPDGNFVQLDYEGRRLSRVVDENREVTSFEFCPVCGAPEGVHAPLDKTLKTTHDGDGLVGQFVDARRKSTTYSYGKGNELTQVAYPDDQGLTLTYDSAHRLKTVTDTGGHTRTMSYDAAGRPQRIHFSGGSAQPDVVFTFFADNRVHTMSDESGTTTYTYTPSRMLETVTRSFVGLSRDQILKYAYNADNTLASRTWLNGTATVVVWTYFYDGAGRVTQVSTSFGSSTAYQRDHEGKLTAVANSNGTLLSYVYNEARGWPVQMTWTRRAVPFASYDLFYDGGANTVGNLTRVVEPGGIQTTYDYDPLYRLVREVRTGGGAYSIGTGYDLANNVVSRNGAVVATHDDGNKIQSLTGGAVAHDGAGNIVTLSGAGVPASTFTWDARNKLRTQTQGGFSISYKYNGDGQRVVRTPSSGATTYYVFDGDTLIGEVTGGVPSVAYAWGPDGLASERLIGSGRTLFYHHGPQGETRQLTDASGNVVDTYLYDAYGKILQTTGSDQNPFRYGGKVGYYADGGSGLVLAGARWYSPNLLRWLSRDPIGYAGGDNQYAYVGGNPVGNVDPLGLQDFPFLVGPEGSPRSVEGGLGQYLNQAEMSPFQSPAMKAPVECPATLSECSSNRRFKPYPGPSWFFHCGYTGFLEDRLPVPGNLQTECFYDTEGYLATNWCGGSANAHDATQDAFWHTVWDKGGVFNPFPFPSRAAIKGFARTVWEVFAKGLSDE
jgi:RHS repeat-associated protein